MNVTSDTLSRPEETTSTQVPLLARLHEWVVTVDHKRLGIMYVCTGLAFLLVAGLQASLIRLQLVVPENTLLSPQVFNRLFTMHGTTMIFFVAIPILFGFANYLVPLMIGARDLAFPRLNAFGFWLTLFGGLLLYFSYVAGEGLYGAGSAPDVGWFAYSPLTGRAFSPGNSTDYWNLAILISGVGTIATGANLIATTCTMRCPGMTLGRMPLLVWMMTVAAGMTLVALPPLSAAQIMLLCDRLLGAHFFDAQAGGSAVLWQHFFWFFGHPEVYILVIPAFAFASEIIPAFSRKVIFGYPMMVAATAGIAFVSMGVWAHHMFAVGLGRTPTAFFAASTMLVAVPTGVKIFNWLGTIYGGRIRFDTPMLFCTAFLFQFLCAGLTGIMLSVAPFDWQLTDSYFVVAHFHFVLIGAILFNIFAAIYYWFPKATGLMLSERLGRWHFWLLVIGFNMTFITLHFAGLLGMPRRIYTYPADRGLEIWNLIATSGALVQGTAILVFLVNVIISLRQGKPSGDDPWDAWTLEWSTTSPPPAYNFDTIPEVKSRRPLWEWKDVFPQQRLEYVPPRPLSERARPVVASPSTVEYLRLGEAGHRVRVPVEVQPYPAGIRGGIIGGIAMAAVALIYGLVAQDSLWYPINLLAGVAIPGMAGLSSEALRAFSPPALIIGVIVHGVISALTGLLYAVLLPMLPRRHMLWGGIIAPLLWTGLIWAVLGVVNPALNARIDWVWFIASQIAFGLTAGFIVARAQPIATMQTWPLAARAGVEATGTRLERERDR